MDKRIITRRIVQGIAVAFGLPGLILGLMGLPFAVKDIQESDRFAMFYMAPAFLLMGGIPVAITWQNLCHFGPNAIKNVTCLVALILYGTLGPLGMQFESAMAGRRIPFVDTAIHLIPLLVAIVFYATVSKKLIQITEPQSIQPEAESVSAETGTSVPPDEPST